MPFVDALPIPPVLQPVDVQNGVAQYAVAMTQFRQQLHRDLPPTTLWGYGDARARRGTYPGPTLEAISGQPIAVRWTNNLPSTHFLPIDPTLHGADPGEPAVRTVVHLHGAKVLPDSDGYPEAWFTNGFRQTGPFFTRDVYQYPNDQPGATLWYHDHGLGITRLNLYTGLEGFYLLRDAFELALPLPRGPYEIPLMIQDRLFAANGALVYPTSDGSDPEVPPVWTPEFFGDTILVNGKVWPFLEVEPRRYRFRILNASNSRFYRLTLVESDASGRRLPRLRVAPVFQQIGTDGGLLPMPVVRSDLLIAPAERCDVILDFTGQAGRSFLVHNDAPAPFPDGDDVVPPQVMLFRVNRQLRGRDDSRVPPVLRPFRLLDPAVATVQRDLILSEQESAAGNPVIGKLDNAMWDDPVVEAPRVGGTEVWRIINTTGDVHPIHVHLVQFQILDRQPFDTDAFAANGSLVFTGPPEPPANNERPAAKDTIQSPPGFVSRIIARFDLPTGTRASGGQRFRYVWHCHILEHEDNEMMRPYDVVG